MKRIFQPWQDTIPLASGASFHQRKTQDEQPELWQERAKMKRAFLGNPLRLLMMTIGIRTWR